MYSSTESAGNSLRSCSSVKPANSSLLIDRHRFVQRPRCRGCLASRFVSNVVELVDRHQRRLLAGDFLHAELAEVLRTLRRIGVRRRTLLEEEQNRVRCDARRLRRLDRHRDRAGLRIEPGRRDVPPHPAAEPRHQMQPMFEIFEARNRSASSGMCTSCRGELIDHLRVPGAALERFDVGLHLGELRFELIGLLPQDGVDPQRLGGENEEADRRQEDRTPRASHGPNANSEHRNTRRRSTR